MKLLNIFLKKSKNKKINIGIGLGDNLSHNIEIINVVEKFLTSNNSTIFLFCTISTAEKLREFYNNNLFIKRLNVIENESPETTIISYLKQRKVDGIIRGGLSANKFLKQLKSDFKLKYINRLALLETIQGEQFFFGPVGIDECRNQDEKINFINKALIEFERFNLAPIISILSGGRKGDIGRDSAVDKTIKEAEHVVNFFKENDPKLAIFHDEILIENAISRGANLIIAPNGIAGNLIYRTLVHLGGGKAYGAIYMGINKPIIDTSRVGKPSEIYGALIMLLALTN
ncbi:MAG: methanogenesis marker protein Mmp4/MtxX [Promethearchaeota archaeon]